jgi:hypothetical protein
VTVRPQQAYDARRRRRDCPSTAILIRRGIAVRRTRTPPEPHALIADQVVEAAERQNGHRPALLVGVVDTVGGTFEW